MKVNQGVRHCIVCEKGYSTGQRELYIPLEHFDDSCICNECLRKERDGWPISSSKIARVHKLSEIQQG